MPNLCTIKGDKIVLYRKSKRMDETHQAASNEPGYSNNTTNLLVNKKENLVVRILATKFHTKHVEEPEADKKVRLNPIMKDLIINGHTNECHKQAIKMKRRKR
jgi:hypothetical protein